MALIGWVDASAFTGIDLDQFPNVKAWHARVLARDAVKKGLAVPNESPISNAALAKRLAEGGEEVRAQAEAAKKLIADAKAEFGYKYTSP
jgi:glutathione S-transferase